MPLMGRNTFQVAQSPIQVSLIHPLSETQVRTPTEHKGLQPDTTSPPDSTLPGPAH